VFDHQALGGLGFLGGDGLEDGRMLALELLLAAGDVADSRACIPGLPANESLKLFGTGIDPGS